MGSKSAPSPPPAPDPARTVAAQAAANKEAAIATARLNQLDEQTPFGTARYEPTGETVDDIDRYRRIVELSPEQQEILSREQAINQAVLGFGQDQLGRIQGNLSQPFNYEGMPAFPQTDEAARQRYEDAMYGRLTKRLDDRFADEQRALETQLATTGHSDPTNEAYRRLMEDFRQAKTDAYDTAASSAIQLGAQEESRLFGLDAAARERAIQEELLRRERPLNELAALTGQSSGITLPQFSPVPSSQIGPANVLGAEQLSYQGQLNNYNQALANQRSFYGNLFGLGGALGSAGILAAAAPSDENLKTDIEPVKEGAALKAAEKLPVAEWRYKTDDKRRIGPMAQDYAEMVGGDGKTIDMISAFGLSLAAIQDLSKKVDKLEKARG